MCPENNNLTEAHAYLSTPRLSLSGIHSLSLSLKHTNIHTLRAHTLTHKPIFHPKIHGGKSLSSSTNHSFSSTLAGTIPSSVPALPLKSLCFTGKHRPTHCHSRLCILSFCWPFYRPVGFFPSWNKFNWGGPKSLWQYFLISQHQASLAQYQCRFAVAFKQMWLEGPKNILKLWHIVRITTYYLLCDTGHCNAIQQES